VLPARVNDAPLELAEMQSPFLLSVVLAIETFQVAIRVKRGEPFLIHSNTPAGLIMPIAAR